MDRPSRIFGRWQAACEAALRGGRCPASASLAAAGAAALWAETDSDDGGEAGWNAGKAVDLALKGLVTVGADAVTVAWDAADVGLSQRQRQREIHRQGQRQGQRLRGREGDEDRQADR